MKTKILPVLSLLAAMTLVACGGGKNDPSKGGNKSNTTQKSSTSKSSAHKHTYGDTYQSDAEGHWKMTTCTEHEPQAGPKEEHTFVEDKTDPEYVAPTCKTAGVKVEKCSVCGYKKKTDVAASYQYHNFGARAWTHTTVTADNFSATSESMVKTCATCNVKDLIVNALDMTATGSTSSDPYANKVADNTRLKFNKNGNYADYTFESDEEFDAMLYLYGVVDYWKDTYNNERKGFFANSSGNGASTANIKVTMNNVDMTIANKATYEEMGIPDATGEPLDSSVVYSGFGLAEVGLLHVNKGTNVLRYERRASYNMDITEFHLMKHTHEYTEGTKAGSLTPITCACGSTGYQMVVADCTEGQKAPVVENNNDAKATRLGKGGIYDDKWDITGIAAGTYELYLNAAASSGNANKGYWNSQTAVDDHGDTKGNNGGDELYKEYKYKVKIGTHDYQNLGNATDNYAAYGIKENVAGWTTKSLATVTIAAEDTTLEIHNMNNGYALWVLGVRLVKVA